MSSQPDVPIVEEEPTTDLELTRLSDGLWLHTSTREVEGFGIVPSHGVIVDGPEGPVLVDSAWGPAATEVLLAEIEQTLGRRPRAAVITDFHDDRAGGVATLEAAGVEVWTSRGVAEQLQRRSKPAPAKTFDGPLYRGRIGGVDVEVFHPGAGHTPDNLVVWLPQHELLFGGCLIRPWASRSLGNRSDARISDWGPSVRAVRERYGHARVVVPSHGEPRDARILDHTIALVDIGLAAEAEAQGEAVPIKVAVTVDDLPRHGPLPKGVTRTEVHATLLDAFKRHSVPRVWGYVIGKHATSSRDHRRALESWLDAGHPLGNHTWSHPNMEEIGVEAYLADVDRNEAVLAELTGDDSGQQWKSFRYPYLRQGFDRDSSDRVRAHLRERGYGVAEVSIDFWDWDYQAPYARCRDAGAEEAVQALRTTFVGRAVRMLQWHQAAARMAFGRPIAHVLLLHGGAFTAEMIDELLTAYEERGVVWVTLEEALADPVYRDVPLPDRTHGDVIVEQAITTLGAEHPPWLQHPGALLHALCK